MKSSHQLTIIKTEKKTNKKKSCLLVAGSYMPGSDDMMLLLVITLDVYVLLLLWADFMFIHAQEHIY